MVDDVPDTTVSHHVMAQEVEILRQRDEAAWESRPRIFIEVVQQTPAGPLTVRGEISMDLVTDGSFMTGVIHNMLAEMGQHLPRRPR